MRKTYDENGVRLIPELGDIVRYIDDSLHVWPAMVLRVWSPFSVDLEVFAPPGDISQVADTVARWPASVQLCDGPPLAMEKIGRWFWPQEGLP